jgi:hypothetical protein
LSDAPIAEGEEEQLDSISTKDDWKIVFAFEKN